MINTQADLKTGWWCFALPGYRDHLRSSTYSLFSYEALPPLEVPTDNAFHWLQSERVHEEWSLADNGYADGSKPDLGKLPDLIAQAELSLPSAFSTFMQSLSLHQRIRSCTACYLDLGDYVVRTSNPANGVLIHYAALLARAAPDVRCTIQLDNDEWQALYCRIHLKSLRSL